MTTPVSVAAARDVSSRNPADFFDPTNCFRFRPDTRFSNRLERCVLGRRRCFVLSNGLHIADPSGHSFWKKFFFIAAAIIVGIVTAQAEIPVMAAAILSAGTVAAAAVEGAAIDRLVGAASSTAEAAPSPGLPATARRALTSPDPGALPHPILDSGPVLLGTPIAQPGGAPNHPIDEGPGKVIPDPIDPPRPGILRHPLWEEPQSLYDALDVSDTPKPKEEQQDRNPENESSNKPEDESKRRQTGTKIPGSDVIHTDHPHGPYKEGHRHWLELHTNPLDPSKRRKVRRTGPL